MAIFHVSSIIFIRIVEIRNWQSQPNNTNERMFATAKLQVMANSTSED